MRRELLSEQVTSLLVQSGRRRRFSRREILFHEGDIADALHVILQGRVAVRVAASLGTDVTVDVLGRGEVLGEIAVVEDEPRRAATSVALEPTTTVAVSRSALDELREHEPAVTEFLFSTAARRNRELLDRVRELASASAETRVLRRLSHLAESYGDDGDSVDISLTQDDVAGLAATTRETVNRVLRREEENGTLALSRGLITVVDRARLARACR